MTLTVTPESAELWFLQILEEFFISVYDEESLPSHGIDHHRRVWNYAKELSPLLNKHKTISDPRFYYKLIIACYLHDVGMSVDPGIIHGHHSRNMCIRFLGINNLDENDYSDVLAAIENHDNKDYTKPEEKNDLLSVLSVADDLDAFDVIGIFRYLEIYLTRGVSRHEIGNLIILNARRRFDNFALTFKYSEELVKKHKKRFEVLNNFFEEYNRQISSYKFGSIYPSGYCGVIEVIDELIQQKEIIKRIKTEREKYSYDNVISWFLEALDSETTD